MRARGVRRFSSSFLLLPMLFLVSYWTLGQFCIPALASIASSPTLVVISRQSLLLFALRLSVAQVLSQIICQ